jgi:glutamine cyclotransferase
MFALGDNIDINLKLVSDSLNPDSIVLFVDDIRINNLQNLNYTLSTESLALGSKQIRATAWLNGNRQTASVGIKLKANSAPKQMRYRVINTYSHDIEAYTQGLFYYNGQFIESTGQKGLSSLRKVEIISGKVLQSVNLDRQYFGEGTTFINGEIYQITWTSRKGFVYDPQTFDLIRTFDYLTQGWGLTTMDDMLIMSDGSNILYFLEPKSFSEIKRVEVYNNRGSVNLLNELEFINGKVYANIYQTDKMVIINPHTGLVEAEIDFSGLLSEADKHKYIDVFNGIAWDEENQRLFVTGKNWPKLFEVEVY